MKTKPHPTRLCSTCSAWQPSPQSPPGWRRCVNACGWLAHYPGEHSCLCWRPAPRRPEAVVLRMPTRPTVVERDSRRVGT